MNEYQLLFLEVVENGGLLVIYDFGGTFSLGYVAGFLIFRKKIMDYRIYTVW